MKWISSGTLAYAFFRGQVKGLREMFAKGWIDAAQMTAQLEEADAKLEAELSQIKVVA